jgi:hypothetical protein
MLEKTLGWGYCGVSDVFFLNTDIACLDFVQKLGMPGAVSTRPHMALVVLLFH